MAWPHRGVGTPPDPVHEQLETPRRCAHPRRDASAPGRQDTATQERDAGHEADSPIHPEYRMPGPAPHGGRPGLRSRDAPPERSLRPPLPARRYRDQRPACGSPGPCTAEKPGGLVVPRWHHRTRLRKRQQQQQQPEGIPGAGRADGDPQHGGLPEHPEPALRGRTESRHSARARNRQLHQAWRTGLDGRGLRRRLGGTSLRAIQLRAAGQLLLHPGHDEGRPLEDALPRADGHHGGRPAPGAGESTSRSSATRSPPRRCPRRRTR